MMNMRRRLALIYDLIKSLLNQQQQQMNKEGNEINLSKLQQSILSEYNRLSYGQQTKIYDTEIVDYLPVPQNLTRFVKQHHQRAIKLKNCSVFQMVTFAVVQYIYHSQQEQQKRVLDKIRNSICDQNFLFGSGYIKGLIIKNLKKIGEKAQEKNIPRANLLKQNDSMTAFTQFWKQIIEEQSEGQIEVFSDEPLPVYFELFSKYLEVGFHLIWKAEEKSREITVNPLEKQEERHFINVVILNRNKFAQKQVLSSIIDDENQEPIEYVLLLPGDIQKVSQFRIELVDIAESQQSEELKRLKLQAWQVKQKGYDLLREVKSFLSVINKAE